MTDRRLSEDHPRDPHSTPWPEMLASFGFTAAEEQQVADEADRMRGEVQRAREAAITRIRTYLEALPDSVNLGAEIAYSGAFRSEDWPHAFYPLLRTDVEALLARVDQLTAERDDSDEYVRRAMEQRRDMAEERFIWQERGDRAEATVERMKRTNRMINAEAKKARERAESAEAKVHAVETIRVWRNEDGRKFMFADEVAVALGAITQEQLDTKEDSDA